MEKKIKKETKIVESKKYVLDTSVIIERVASRLIENNELKGKFVVPNAVLSELEHQANVNQETGFIGLDEISELNALAKEKKIQLEFQGPRPTAGQIKSARVGEIDAIIRDIAVQNNAELITADIVQAKSAEVFGIPVRLIKHKKIKKSLSIEKFFKSDTMSIHLKEDSYPYGKQGKPGEWELVKLGNKKLSKIYMQKISKEIIEKARATENSFVEISRPGLNIVQYGQYRIVIVKQPLADGLEITIVRPLHKFSLEHYKLEKEILKRLEKARGIIIAGEPGSGKSTFVQALAEFYAEKGKIVKTVESPRDLQLPAKITQYSKNFGSSSDIHDILFLSRPDYIIFDEMRDTPDFILYTDLRLAGSECIGVLHSASPIDAIQRFIGRLQIGMIPSVVDTILYMQAGKINTILTLELKVKVPSGMFESDLVRPVIEVRDFITKKLFYEIYKYGEETVVVPLEKRREKGNENESNLNENYNEGTKSDIRIKQTKHDLIIYASPGNFLLKINGQKVTNLSISDSGVIMIHKRSRIGNLILRAMKRRSTISLE